MNKKWLKTILVLASLTLTSCGEDPLKSFEKKIGSSLKSVSKVEVTTTILDDEVEVYRALKTVELEYEGKNVRGNVTLSVTSLNSSFGYESEETTDSFEGASKDVLFGLSLDKAYFVTYTLEEDVLTGEVDKEKAGKFFQIADLNVPENPEVTIALTDKKISSYRCAYVTSGERQVSITASYTY